MSYSDTIRFLYGLQKHGIKLGLENMRTLMAKMGMPHQRCHTVHIGGTNGKGSTAAMAAAILQAAGYRVGLYTSPHLVDFRERIRVNGKMISESVVMDLTRRLRGMTGTDLSPTFFEFTTAMAFQYFADSAVDVAILEVGMGGRFDATNVIDPLVSVVTTIALDHEAYLGSSLEAIAFEKAGIIKPMKPTILGRVGDQAARVIEEAAMERRSALYRLNRNFRIINDGSGGFRYEGVTQRYERLSCPLAGHHQLDNAACAVAVVEAVALQGLPVPEAAVRTGLHDVQWEGRLEVLEHDPTVLVDGAHNPAAAEVLGDYLLFWRQHHAQARVILILGMMCDKDHKKFIHPLRSLVDEVIVTQADIARAATVQALQQSLAGECSVVHVAPIPADALALAKRRASSTDLICVAGSLMLVGDMKALLLGCGLSPLRG